jgi:uncharacterized protein DUF6773
MKSQGIIKDERTTTIENASYRWAYILLSFGVLLSVAFRGFVWNEASWDLLALVIVSGFIATFYQGIHRVLTGRWALMAVVTAVAAAIVAAGVVLLMR